MVELATVDTVSTSPWHTQNEPVPRVYWGKPK